MMIGGEESDLEHRRIGQGCAGFCPKAGGAFLRAKEADNTKGAVG